jgi:hypothetical protein
MAFYLSQWCCFPKQFISKTLSEQIVLNADENGYDWPQPVSKLQPVALRTQLLIQLHNQ